MYPHRGMGGAPPGAAASARLNELIDGIRAEVDSLQRQCENYEHQSKHGIAQDPNRWSPPAKKEKY